MRRPLKTITINASAYLGFDTYQVKVKTKATDCRDSAESNVITVDMTEMSGPSNPGGEN